MASHVRAMLDRIKARLDCNEPFVSEAIKVVVEEEGDTLKDLLQRLSGIKLGVVVSCFEFRPKGAGGCDFIVTLTITEKPKINRDEGGTPAREVAVAAQGLLNGWRPSEQWAELEGQGAERKAAELEGQVMWEAKFAASTMLEYESPQEPQ